MTANAARAPAARRSRSSPVLRPDFYARDTALVARELLGAVLECESERGVASGRIVETEAYLGAHDPACHAAAGLTERTRHLHGPAGIAYVYFIYGSYWCFNAVTEREGVGSAVLVRAVEPLEGLALMRARRPNVRADRELTNGPGKLCQALGIDGRHRGGWLQRPPLMIRRGDAIPDRDVVVTPRIGISRAAAWPLRWLVRDSAFVSRTPSHFERTPLAR
jgi:DNA-3-methyladenine glycosylase